MFKPKKLDHTWRCEDLHLLLSLSLWYVFITNQKINSQTCSNGKPSAILYFGSIRSATVGSRTHGFDENSLLLAVNHLRHISWSNGLWIEGGLASRQDGMRWRSWRRSWLLDLRRTPKPTSCAHSPLGFTWFRPSWFRNPLAAGENEDVLTRQNIYKLQIEWRLMLRRSWAKESRGRCCIMPGSCQACHMGDITRTGHKSW